MDLATQMARDNVETPPILEKCAEAIEAIGIQSMGIYRLSGTSSKVQRLRSKFDQDWAQVDLMNDEAINDINIVAGCLKLWFRELPEPLLTHELYAGFIEAASECCYLFSSVLRSFRRDYPAHAPHISQRSPITGSGTFGCTSASTSCPTPTTRRSKHS